MQATTILIAGTPEAIETARYALGGNFSYHLARTVDQAISLVSPDIDLILCNVSFDESRMLEFIRLAREAPASRHIPIVCFRQHRRAFKRSTYDAIEVVLGTYERTSFVDLYDVSQRGGLSNALLAFRAAVMKALAVETRIASIPAAADPVSH